MTYRRNTVAIFISRDQGIIMNNLFHSDFSDCQIGFVDCFNKIIEILNKFNLQRGFQRQI